MVPQVDADAVASVSRGHQLTAGFSAANFSHGLPASASVIPLGAESARASRATTVAKQCV